MKALQKILLAILITSFLLPVGNRGGFPGSGQDKFHVLTGLDNLLENHTDKLAGKNIGIVTNQTGVDREGTFIWERIERVPRAKIVALFSPEHGLFGEASDGETVVYEGQERTLPRKFSLYGKSRKPTEAMLEGVDLLVYDIQDVGARFYTFITTMGLTLEAAGEAEIPVLILDRPNPITGTRVEGPILDLQYQSFVGYFPIPSRYGLTPGELARMVVDRGWIKYKPELEVIPLIGWNRNSWYDDTDLIWVRPSPNIPDVTTAVIYPGMVHIEATNVSEGRGTDHPFRWVGAPWIEGNRLAEEMNKAELPGVVFRPVQFTPKHLPGVASHPKYEGLACQGIETVLTDRMSFEAVKTGLALLLALNRLYSAQLEIHPGRMNRLVGSDLVVQALEENWSLDDIVASYAGELRAFEMLRQPYLLY